MNSDNQSNQLAWGRYWEKGFLTTFSGESDANYTGLIKDFWISEFEILTPNSLVLDCCSGNGAILALAKEFMNEKGVNHRLIAVDYAEIQSSNDFFSNNSDIQVFARTKIEDMPEEIQGVDLCVSQFGVEYTDLGASLSEIARVLKPGGKFCALIHHVNSNITNASRLSVDQIKFCFDSSLPEIVLQLLTRLEELILSEVRPNTDAVSENLRNMYNIEAQRVWAYAESLADSAHINYFLGELSGVFSGKAKGLSFEQKKQIVRDVGDESKLYERRMRAMLEASHDEASIRMLESELRNQGFEDVSVEEMTAGSEVAAWKVRGFLMPG